MAVEVLARNPIHIVPAVAKVIFEKCFDEVSCGTAVKPYFAYHKVLSNSLRCPLFFLRHEVEQH